MTDCSRCQGLCCVALAFERSADFAIDKPAGVPCQYLGDDDRCRIHGSRAARGFGGCVRYDCGGAGARAVASSTRPWRESAHAAEALYEAFRVERDVAEARVLLEAAGELPLPEAEELRRAALAAELDPARWAVLAGPIRSFVRGLRRLPIFEAR